MILLPLALLLLAGPRIVLDDTIEVPAAEWRYVDIVAKEPMAVVNCQYEALSEKTLIRAVWIARGDLESFRGGHREKVLAATTYDVSGKLRHFAPAPGDYAMLIENDPASHARAKVKVKVWVESAVSPKYVSPERRLAVILISAVVFFGIVSVSAFQIRRQLKL